MATRPGWRWPDVRVAREMVCECNESSAVTTGTPVNLVSERCVPIDIYQVDPVHFVQSDVLVETAMCQVSYQEF